jgi:hypothetical protein
MRWGRMAWCVGSVVALVGCGGSAAPDGGATGTDGVSQLPPQLASDVAAFADAYAKAWCDGLAACCHFWPFHQDVCLTNARQLGQDMVAGSVLSGSTLPHLDTDAQSGCLAGVSAIVAACPSTTFAATPTPECALVFTTGTSPQGGACSLDSDCEPLAAHAAVCVNDVCTVPATNLPSGAACSVGPSTCEAGLVCNPGTYVCSPPVAIGKRCDSETDCVDGAWCEGDCEPFTPVGDACTAIVECGPTARCYQNVCQALVVTGAPCTDSGGCMPSDYCPPATGVCTTRIPIGGACPVAPVSDSDQPCADGGYCSHTSGTLLLSGDTSPLVCIPTNLPILCYTG